MWGGRGEAGERKRFRTVSSVQSLSRCVRPHGLQHARPPCPSPTPGVYSNSCPLSQWCHPTISSSVVPFSFPLQSFPASGSFPMTQLFASGGQSIGVSASALVLSVNIHDWFPLGWTGRISLHTGGMQPFLHTDKTFGSFSLGKCKEGSEGLVTQLCPILCDPMDCSLSGSSVHGILQASILEWVAVHFSRGSSRSKDWTRISCLAKRFFTVWATQEALLGKICCFCVNYASVVKTCLPSKVVLWRGIQGVLLSQYCFLLDCGEGSWLKTLFSCSLRTSLVVKTLIVFSERKENEANVWDEMTEGFLWM